MVEWSPATWSVLTAVFVGGAAWGGTKKALNGTRQRVKDVQEQLTVHIKEEHDADVETHERIARMETKIDILLERDNRRI